MIDLHSHILPGLDDGVRSLEEARELARASLADGVRAIAATPHVREDYPTTADEMEAGVAAVRADLVEHGLQVKVLAGGELSLDALQWLSPAELRRFSLGATGRYLLVEFPYYGWPLALETSLAALGDVGMTAVLAHPERNPDVQERPALLEAAVASGALVQITAASLDGRLGKHSKQTAKALLELGFAHVLASDAHSANVRGAGLLAAARTLKDATLARYLTLEAPAAIIAAEPLRARASRQG
ncbi:MAG: phosphotransferase [Actinobacteria bacterium]|nr:phosphotransferase [Actinomycetota bacterium]